jgi:hypothetical protein
MRSHGELDLHLASAVRFVSCLIPEACQLEGRVPRPQLFTILKILLDPKRENHTWPKSATIKITRPRRDSTQHCY